MLKEVRLHGERIAPILRDLADLRMAVFRDFPYLYEGSLAYELHYLQRYVETPESLVFAIYDAQKMVGATTAMPLAAESAAIQAPFSANGQSLQSVYYFGESILLPAYRGQGWGHRFFDERERFALQHPGIHQTCFCAVERAADHPLRPANYRPNDAFWHKRGYTKRPELQCQMAWKDLDEQQESPKTLTFWTKSWH